VQYVQDLIAANGNQSFTLESFPTQPHDMHSSDPATYVTAITGWMARLGLGSALTPNKTQVAAAEAKVSAAATSPPSCPTTTSKCSTVAGSASAVARLV